MSEPLSAAELRGLQGALDDPENGLDPVIVTTFRRLLATLDAARSREAEAVAAERQRIREGVERDVERFAFGLDEPFDEMVALAAVLAIIEGDKP